MSAIPFFQEAQDACFRIILAWYGQDCAWKKTGGDIEGTVLFNDPTKQLRFNIISGRGLSHIGYDNADVITPYIEYPKGKYEGLWELVYENNVNQYIETGGKRFVCSNVNSFFDGQTYRIYLEEASTEELVPET